MIHADEAAALIKVCDLLREIVERCLHAELLREELAAAIGPNGVTLATEPPELAAYGAAGALTGTALELLAGAGQMRFSKSQE